MRIHSLQHVPFEDMAAIEPWMRRKGYSISRTLLFLNEALPSPEDFDWLVIMGGPMGVHDEDRFPWLVAEKKFIEEAISAGKIVLGVCLGAQLIAEVLGARVSRNEFREIGWFPVKLVPEARSSMSFRNFPPHFMAFHWHGDTFDIPKGCVRTAESEGCPNQAFEYDGRVVGLQFHLESTEDSINRLIEHSGGDIVEGRYVQSAGEMAAGTGHLDETGRTMSLLLENMARRHGEDRQ